MIHCELLENWPEICIQCFAREDRGFGRNEGSGRIWLDTAPYSFLFHWPLMPYASRHTLTDKSKLTSRVQFLISSCFVMYWYWQALSYNVPASHVGRG